MPKEGLHIYMLKGPNTHLNAQVYILQAKEPPSQTFNIMKNFNKIHVKIIKQYVNKTIKFKVKK